MNHSQPPCTVRTTAYDGDKTSGADCAPAPFSKPGHCTQHSGDSNASSAGSWWTARAAQPRLRWSRSADLLHACIAAGVLHYQTRRSPSARRLPLLHGRSQAPLVAQCLPSVVRRQGCCGGALQLLLQYYTDGCHHCEKGVCPSFGPMLCRAYRGLTVDLVGEFRSDSMVMTATSRRHSKLELTQSGNSISVACASSNQISQNETASGQSKGGSAHGIAHHEMLLCCIVLAFVRMHCYVDLR